MAATTSTTLDDLFANIIAQARFTAEEESLMLGLVTRYDIGNEAGKTIQVPKYPAITAAALRRYRFWYCRSQTRQKQQWRIYFF